ncbi:hypothetical protein GLOTRDRAFT_134986 [Gloeophyllum trabeum ATCC 11539]|uniref:Cleavage stimulation factor subunit 2 hinge domain-containing protein n=1 Tax=Gloeophyllum trabeum (strain ATCC 11539 / FP-39264 / Madison 617) TaxID=670483 RepID=S7QLK6_GLOTA|nr:uncharacterized protein GLOTRDRAFT_134986 [Gloeophyllum trabeum ATCC 11539]EPQ60272.1 hypothetical protein GLOTRDRAFT_134986 [Gloeophyllum trabeum ATCC 11539]
MSQAQDDQLIELLLQLRKTTPEQARQVLNAQPQLSYLLISLMVKMNAINLEALQKTLASYIPATGQPAAPSVPGTAAVPPSAIPPHVAASSQYRTATPPNVPVPPASFQPPPSSAYPPYHGAPPTNTYGAPGGLGGPPPLPGYPAAPAPAPAPAPAITADALAAMPEQQRAMITRIITMTPETIRALPPHERDPINQIVSIHALFLRDSPNSHYTCAQSYSSHLSEYAGLFQPHAAVG